MMKVIVRFERANNRTERVIVSILLFSCFVQNMKNESLVRILHMKNEFAMKIVAYDYPVNYGKKCNDCTFRYAKRDWSSQ